METVNERVGSGADVDGRERDDCGGRRWSVTGVVVVEA